MNKRMRIKCIAVIVGITILPLLYSYLYLGAFWDPYSRLETLPIAVVNNDKGAVINEAQRNLGKEMSDSLREDGSLKFVFTDEQEAKSGTEDSQYYAMLVIPSDFSQNIASASSLDKQTAVIEYAPNQKRNYLASQILGKAVLQIEVTLREKVDKELVQQLADQLKSVPEQMTTLSDGLGEMADGATALNNGASDLADGTNTFHNKFNEYQSGVGQVKNGSASLSDGIQSLDNGLSTLLAGMDQINEKTAAFDTLQDGAQKLAQGAETFNGSLLQYTNGVNGLISSLNDLKNGLTLYVTKVNPALMTDPQFAAIMKQLGSPEKAQQLAVLANASDALKAGYSQIEGGIQKISQSAGDKENGIPKLKEALLQIRGGLSAAKEGSSQLVAGSQTLDNGIGQLNNATLQLGDASAKIADGAGSLKDGTGKLSDGVNTARSEVQNSTDKASGELDKLNGLADYASAPVSIQENDITSVPNYGTAFAPYFLSLSLWVGGLMIFVAIYYDPENKFRLLARDASNWAFRSIAYLGLGVIQAVVLGIVLMFGLGLKVDNIPLYFASCMLVSLVFISIIQFFMVFFKDLGKFISMLLLILQLTSCGGTFPMEVVPGFFNALYKYMPMTYSVGLFKQSISGVRVSDLIYNMGILFVILLAFLALTFLSFSYKSKRQKVSQVEEAYN